MHSDGDTIGLDDAPASAFVLPARYRDLGLIAVGGFGEVRRVEDLHLGCILAMKIQLGLSEEVKRRLAAEARLTAWLHHPGIVAVQDLGELPDGRTWYTMEEVRGATFAAVLREGWTLRRVVDVLARACQAVASAHSVGVIHRDLKPDNIMVGAFGEVRVMDWGLARGEPDDGLPEGENTQAGRVLGTPAYMPPEQARGELDRLGPPSDVYALGAMLYTALAGHPPYEGGARAAWLAVLAAPPPALPQTAPHELVSICERAMARDPADRFPNADALATELLAWLEGARKEAEAQALVAAARARLPGAAALRAEAADKLAASRAALDGVPPNAPSAEKLAGWRLEEAAHHALAEARRIEAELIRDLRAALTGSPDLPSAHEALADLYRHRLDEAEASGNLDSAAEYELALRTHDRGQHARWLAGNGTLTLVTDPPDARVEAFRLVERDRRLVEVPIGVLGATPLVDVPLPRGTYVLHLRAPGRALVRYPVQIGRLDAWAGVRPGATEPHPILLPAGLGTDVCYVPAGWFWSGGDPAALDSLPRRRLWVDAFVIRRFPVTNAEFITFLDDLVRRGRVEDAERWAPRLSPHAPILFSRRPDGTYALMGATSDGQVPTRLDEPVAFVDAAACDAFATWEADRSGEPWRLPHDLEWEKAARGVDGRAWPWGDRFDPSWTCMQLSHVGVPTRAPVEAYAEDESVYGVRGLGGNVRDWCANGYRRHGLPPEVQIVDVTDTVGNGVHRMVRGGSTASSADFCRVAGRMAWNPANRGAAIGFRLVRSLRDPTR